MKKKKIKLNQIEKKSNIDSKYNEKTVILKKFLLRRTRSIFSYGYINYVSICFNINLFFRNTKICVKLTFSHGEEFDTKVENRKV